MNTKKERKKERKKEDNNIGKHKHKEIMKERK